MDDPQQEQPPQQPQPVSPQRRLQELRAIPEKDRTDAQWDELNEIEIALASANRAGGPGPNAPRQENRPRGGGGGGQNGQRDGNNRQNGKPGGNRGHRRPSHRDRQR
jgi:hypothetical protein